MQLPTIPRLRLVTLPTPIQRARRLETALGPRSPRIWIKRDDLTGFAFGGNKARKLEYLLADAMAQQATVLITEGAAQSNHARITAAAATVAGLKSLLILDARNGAEIGGNLLIDHLLDAEVRIVPDKEARTSAMANIAGELVARGERPYVIPAGGSVPVGAVGYVTMVHELMQQLIERDEAPTHLYTSTSSTGTQAGLVVGAQAVSAPFQIVGVAADAQVTEMEAKGTALAAATSHLLGLDIDPAGRQFEVDGSQVGGGYGQATPEAMEAIRLLARTEAFFLDPVYSGKAMAALIASIRGGKHDPTTSIIFLHTGGGPSLFAWGERLLA